jgi:hypothetical protein
MLPFSETESETSSTFQKTRYLQVAQPGGHNRYINMDHELFAAALAGDLRLECVTVDECKAVSDILSAGADNSVVERAFDGTDMSERYNTFELLINHIKAKEPELVRRVRDSGIDEYETSETGARDSKTYEVEMTRVRFEILKTLREELTGPASKTISSDDWQNSRAFQAGVEWDEDVGDAKGVSITQRRSAKAQERIDSLVQGYKTQGRGNMTRPDDKDSKIFTEQDVHAWNEGWVKRIPETAGDSVSTGQRPYLVDEGSSIFTRISSRALHALQWKGLW